MSASPLVTGDLSACQALQHRARQVCVIYHDHPMPPGVTPSQARIGIEVDPATQRTRLFVDRGLNYAGADSQVARWLRDGQLDFPDFPAAHAWLGGLVAPGRSPATPGPPAADRDLAVEVALAAPARAIPCRMSAQELADAVKQVVRGQDHVLDRLTQIVVRHLARNEPARPATFLLVGPTGVGKTRTVERLAEVLAEQGGDVRYDWLRLDMNEYREAHRVSALLGAPPGYIGYRDGAVLADALEHNPRQIVLFDEIDKAHPDVLIVLMNLIDSGRLSRPGVGGSATDGRRAILVFTSNQSADQLVRRVNPARLTDADVDEICRVELQRSGVAPELLGRIRSVLFFGPLDLRALAEIAFAAVVRAGAEYGLQVTSVEPVALRRILDDYTALSLGARPIEHAVDDLFADEFLIAARSGTTRAVTCGYRGGHGTVVAVPDRALRPLREDS